MNGTVRAKAPPATIGGLAASAGSVASALTESASSTERPRRRTSMDRLSGSWAPTISPCRGGDKLSSKERSPEPPPRGLTGAELRAVDPARLRLQPAHELVVDALGAGGAALGGADQVAELRRLRAVRIGAGAGGEAARGVDERRSHRLDVARAASAGEAARDPDAVDADRTRGRRERAQDRRGPLEACRRNALGARAARRRNERDDGGEDDCRSPLHAPAHRRRFAVPSRRIRVRRLGARRRPAIVLGPWTESASAPTAPHATSTRSRRWRAVSARAASTASC